MTDISKDDALKALLIDQENREKAFAKALEELMESHQCRVIPEIKISGSSITSALKIESQ